MFQIYSEMMALATRQSRWDPPEHWRVYDARAARDRAVREARRSFELRAQPAGLE